MQKNGTSSSTNLSSLARHHGRLSARRCGKYPVRNYLHRRRANLRRQSAPSGDRVYRRLRSGISLSILSCHDMLLHSGVYILTGHLIGGISALIFRITLFYCFPVGHAPATLAITPRTCTLYSSVPCFARYVFVGNCRALYRSFWDFYGLQQLTKMLKSLLNNS
jgi:hypothetical protein